jgi:hypothetical protein
MTEWNDVSVTSQRQEHEMPSTGPSNGPSKDSAKGSTKGTTKGKKKSSSSGPSEEMKAKFREALDKKHAHAGMDVSADGESPKVSDAHGPAKAQQMFRRKAGS